MWRNTTFVVAAFEGTYLTSYLITTILHVLSLTVYKIFGNKKKCTHIHTHTHATATHIVTTLIPSNYSV